MLSEEHKIDWIMLFSIGIILFFLYGFNLKEMFKSILSWGFALIGFKLLFEAGIIQKLKNDKQKTP